MEARTRDKLLNYKRLKIKEINLAVIYLQRGGGPKYNFYFAPN